MSVLSGRKKERQNKRAIEMRYRRMLTVALCLARTSPAKLHRLWLRLFDGETGG